METESLEDRILISIDPNFHKPKFRNESWVKKLKWKDKQEYDHLRTPSSKKQRQKERIDAIESWRSKNFEIYNILKTRLHIRPQFTNSDNTIIHISSKQSFNPKIIFSLKKINIKSFIDFDLKHNRCLVNIGDERTLLFNTFPTCVYDVPKCDSIQELQVMTTKIARRNANSRQVIRTFNLIPDLLYFVLYHTNKPSQFTMRRPIWGDNYHRQPGIRYQDPHHLILKFYPDYRDRIDYISLIDNTVLHDRVLNKWVKFEFYPCMFEKVASYSFGTKYDETGKVLLLSEDFKICGFN